MPLNINALSQLLWRNIALGLTPMLHKITAKCDEKSYVRVYFFLKRFVLLKFYSSLIYR